MIRRTLGINSAVLAVASLMLASGCASQPPNAAATLSRLESEPQIDTMLSESEQREVIDAMKTLAVDHTPDPPGTFVREMRWSDIPRAVAEACDRVGVEMAVISREEHEWGTIFRLRTVEDRPATLEVRKTLDERIYTARATIGRFNLEADQPRAERLLEGIEDSMQKYGAKRRLMEESSRGGR